METKATNPNDFKVVSFTNKTSFDFTPDMGCMYDGRPISGIKGIGISAGESMTLPYHIGHQLAVNLAKLVKIKGAPLQDEPNNPVGKPLWSDDELARVKDSFLTELYSEARPAAMTETDRLMAKVEEYKKMVDQLISTKTADATVVPVETPNDTQTVIAPKTFADKQDVIAELEARGIPHDKRANKATLEKLLNVGA